MNGGHGGGISIFGVVAFVIAVLALGTLIVRRDNRKPLAAIDYTMMFVGIAGVIIGIAVLFLRF